MEGIALILRAIDLTIVEVEARGGSDSDEELQVLRSLRERWRQKARVEGG